MCISQWRCLAATLFAVVLSAPTAQADLCFDDFGTAHNAEDQTSDGTSEFDSLADGGVFGGHRRLVVNKDGDGGASRVTMDSGGFAAGTLSFDQQGAGVTGAHGIGTLIYDGDAAGTGTTVNPMIADTDLTAGNTFLALENLVVLGNGINLTIDVFDGGVVGSYSVELANQPTAATLQIPFSAFTNSSVFTSANAIRLTFDGSITNGISGQGSDLSFTKLSASAPEPTSFLLAGLGMLGLVRVRRRKDEA